MEIHDLARAGDTAAIAQLLEQGADVNAQEESSFESPLACATLSDRAGLDTMRLLIDNGAVVQTKYVNVAQELISRAVEASTLEKVALLLDSGASIDLVDDHDQTLLESAVNRDRNNAPGALAMVRLLLARGASPQVENSWGGSIVLVASDLGRFDIVSEFLRAGADGRTLKWTSLMRVIALGSADDVRRELERGADLNARDHAERTPWLLSVHTGDVAKAELVLAAGADVNVIGSNNATTLFYAARNNATAMLRWIIELGAELDSRNGFGFTALTIAAMQFDAGCARVLVEAGASTEQVKLRYPGDEIKIPDPNDPNYVKPPPLISSAETLEIARILAEAGDDFNKINDRMRAKLTGQEYEGEIRCTTEEYKTGRNAKFGLTNPEIMEAPFWKAMVRSGRESNSLRRKFGEADVNAWSFRRRGKSITELSDGRILEIGGSHDDAFGFEFCVYNDLVVHHGNGEFTIFGYPYQVFPPTDFHTATQVGDSIYIIGSGGYPKLRQPGFTPVFRLDLTTFSIEAIATTGENPGWIYQHRARLETNGVIKIWGGTIFTDQGEYLKNMSSYTLDLQTLVWRKNEP